MRRFVVCLALVTMMAAIHSTPGVAAPRPPTPPPPAQGTITISYFGAGSITESPVPEATTTSTLDLEYREVFRVTGGAYDKEAGTIDLIGAGTVSYRYAESGDASIVQSYSCGYTGMWFREERRYGRFTAERSGTYAAGVHRRGTMSSRTQGELHIGRYPGSDPANQDWSVLPLVSWTQERQQSTHYQGKTDDCYPANPSSGSDSASSSNTSGVEVNGVFPDFYISPVPPVPVTLDRKGHLKGNETFLLRWGNSGFNRPNVPVVVVASVDVVFAAGLVADPGGPYSVTRGEPVTLDAGPSRTTDGVAIRSYSWSWAPGSNCPAGTTLANMMVPAGPAATRTIIPLCNLEVTLTVKDAKRRVATATTFVTVRPRQQDFASTPVTTSTENGIPSEFGGDMPPRVAGLIGGVNVADCANPQPAVFESPWFCPAPTNLGGGNGTWLDNGYTIGNVADPGGPFDGFAWITSTGIVAARKVYINNYLRSGGPMPAGASENFYDANSTAGNDVNGFLSAVEAHEGEGTAINPLAGHTGTLRSALTRYADGAPIDPRRRIEGLIARNRDTLKTSADAQLVASEHALCVATADPLAIIWSGTILLWDDAAFFPDWEPTPMIVGGQGSTQC